MHNRPETMQAVVIESADGPAVLRELPFPSAGPGEVLVKVHASGVNPLDLKIRSGNAGHARHPFPAILGIDLAGTVAAVGPGVTGFAEGDEVFGMTGGVGGIQGSLATYVSVDARLIAHKPANITMRDAASLPLAFITAWEGLVDRARVGKDMTVLVHGGAGGVGYMAIQIAHALGAKVFTTVSAKDIPTVEARGATAIDRHALTVEAYVAAHTGGKGFDVVFDTVGGDVLDASFQAIRRFGRVLSALGWGTHALAPLSFRGGTYSGVFTLLPLLTNEGREHHGQIMEEAAGLIAAGQLQARVDASVFDLASTDAAHELVRAAGSQGKVVITVAD